MCSTHRIWLPGKGVVFTEPRSPWGKALSFPAKWPLALLGIAPESFLPSLWAEKPDDKRSDRKSAGTTVRVAGTWTEVALARRGIAPEGFSDGTSPAAALLSRKTLSLQKPGIWVKGMGVEEAGAG